MKSIFILLFAVILTCNIFADTTEVAATLEYDKGNLTIYHVATLDSGTYVVSDDFRLDEFVYQDSLKANYAVLISGTGDTIRSVIEGTYDGTNYVMVDTVITYLNGATQTLQKAALDIKGVKYPFYRLKIYAHKDGTIKHWLYFLKPY